jgi:hypothetical protein
MVGGAEPHWVGPLVGARVGVAQAARWQRWRKRMRPLLGKVVLVVSGLGFPLTQAAIARGGRRGAVLVEGVAVALLVRDGALVRSGLPARLLPLPRLLLRLELGAAILAALTGLTAVARPSQRGDRSAAGVLESVRRLAVGLLFGLHTYRFKIYLEPDRGLRPPDGELTRSGPPRPRR